jgi:hypothetical protein
MSNDNEPSSVTELKQANRDLTESLKKCQALVAECRDKLAANGEASFLLDPRQRKR